MPLKLPQSLKTAPTVIDLSQLLDSLPIGMLLVAADGRVEFINARAAVMFGYSQTEIAGTSVDALVPQALRAKHGAYREAYVAQPEQRPMGLGRDLYAVRKNGSEFPVEIGLAPYVSEGHTYVLCTVVDISDRRRQEREKDALLRSLEEKSGRIETLYRISQLSRSATQDSPMLLETVESIRTHLVGWPVTAIRLELDGAVYESKSSVDAPVESVSAPVLAEGRRRGELRALLTGVPDDRAEEFARALQVFATMIGETLERREAVAKVVHASQLASIGELAAGIGHEVNNPINGIINCVDILLRNAAEGSKERQFLDLIRQESYRVAKIASGLLAFARGGPAQAARANVDKLIANVLALCNHRFEKSSINVERRIAPDLPEITCRAEQIQQILLNLVLNAVHALNERYPGADPGKILLITADVVVIRDEPHVEIGVEDRGNGIEKAQMDRIFDPFYTTKGKLGTGLGLPVSLSIARAHGGWIRVESEPGAYARFVLQLPVNAVTPAP